MACSSKPLRRILLAAGVTGALSTVAVPTVAAGAGPASARGAAVTAARVTAHVQLDSAPTDTQSSTPACPVSATHPECSWNVPVDSANPFGAGDYGQCPYWAAEKYPALVHDEASGDPVGENWNGGTWAEHAAAEGLAIVSTPASGDLAVWESRSADPYGHVAYVEAVLDGAIIVSQMDGASQPPFPAMQGSTEYISADQVTEYEQSYGLSFVATDSPSTTPAANLELDPVAVSGDAAAPAADSATPAVSVPATTAVHRATPKPRRHHRHRHPRRR